MARAVRVRRRHARASLSATVSDLKLTFKDFEGGATYTLRDVPGAEEDTLGKWRSFLELHKAEVVAEADQAVFGVLRETAVGGFRMHLLRCGREQIELFTAGTRELTIRLTALQAPRPSPPFL